MAANILAHLNVRHPTRERADVLACVREENEPSCSRDLWNSLGVGIHSDTCIRFGNRTRATLRQARAYMQARFGTRAGYEAFVSRCDRRTYLQASSARSPCCALDGMSSGPAPRVDGRVWPVTIATRFHPSAPTRAAVGVAGASASASARRAAAIIIISKKRCPQQIFWRGIYNRK